MFGWLSLAASGFTRDYFFFASHRLDTNSNRHSDAQKVNKDEIRKRGKTDDAIDYRFNLTAG